MIIYYEERDTGASYFIRGLAKELTQAGSSVIYLKFTENILSEKYFLAKLNLPSFDALKSILCQSASPYLIIDNF